MQQHQHGPNCKHGPGQHGQGHGHGHGHGHGQQMPQGIGFANQLQ